MRFTAGSPSKRLASATGCSRAANSSAAARTMSAAASFSPDDRAIPLCASAAKITPTGTCAARNRASASATASPAAPGLTAPTQPAGPTPATRGPRRWRRRRRAQVRAPPSNDRARRLSLPTQRRGARGPVAPPPPLESVPCRRTAATPPPVPGWHRLPLRPPGPGPVSARRQPPPSGQGRPAPPPPHGSAWLPPPSLRPGVRGRRDGPSTCARPAGSEVSANAASARSSNSDAARV